jgi:hypothetical protein
MACSFNPTDHLGLDNRSSFLVVVKGGRFVLLSESTAKH